ncbi:MAG: hypothetical protein M3388_01355 [Acidobacteriota bacterium]|nr:hypothetical protein [Acidobacteriota bacterium]
METKIEKEVRFLKIYALVATLFCAVFLLTAFASQNKKQKFEEIDVERINVVEKDGRLRMVISNEQRQHPGMVEGKLHDRKREVAGMLFFNEKGDEAGGLIVSNDEGKSQYLSLTFDKFRQDQTMGLQHLESTDGSYFAGLKIWDRPDISFDEQKSKREAIKNIPDEAKRKAALKELAESGVFGNERLALGRGRNKSSFIELADTKGKTRLEISVDENGTPKINFLDENGKVIYSLPDESKVSRK